MFEFISDFGGPTTGGGITGAGGIFVVFSGAYVGGITDGAGILAIPVVFGGCTTGGGGITVPDV